MSLAPIDENIRLPAAVKAAAAKSEEIFKTNYKKEEQPGEPAPQDPPAAAPPANQPGDRAGNQSQDATPPQELQAPAEPTATPASAAIDEKSWEHRFSSMKGRWEAEKARNREAADQIRSLMSRVSELEAQLNSRSDKRTDNPTPERLVTREEEESFGTEFLNVVGKKAKEELSPLVQSLYARIDDLEGKLGNLGVTVEKTARDKLFEHLDKGCPQWRELNNNEDFLRWLALPDRLSGVIRHDLLNAAYERNDSPRVLAFFKGFLSEEAALAPQTVEPDTATIKREEPQRQPKVPLESLAAPGRAKTAAPPAPAEKPTFTRAQVAEFYADVTAGRYRGREQDKDNLERQIFLAQKEGRIR